MASRVQLGGRHEGGLGPGGRIQRLLVRQSGLIPDTNRGVAVAMLAKDDSGTYPAGASDLTQIAQWLAGGLNGLGPAFHGCAG